MTAVLHTVLLLVLAADADTDVLIPGHEAAVVGLLSPDDTDTFRCGAWQLDSVVPGPDCAVRFHMIHPEREAPVVVRLSRSAPGIAVALETGEPRPDGVGEVLDCIKARIHENAVPNFFEDKCVLADEAISVEVHGAGGRVRLVVLGLGALLGLGLLLRWRNCGRGFPKGAPISALERASHKDLLLLAAWIAPALALRAWLMQVLPPGAYEVENFGLGAPFSDLVLQTGVARGWLDPAHQSFHPPLMRVLLDPWLLLGDRLGVGGTLVWLRLPNLAFTVAAVALLMRLGATLGAPAAGRLAALLFAWLPPVVLLSVYQGHYFLELVLTLWFTERLAAWVLLGRPVFISLPLAAALALWTGHFAAFTVAPGVAIFLVMALRRGCRREALASLLLLTALYLPVAEGAVLGALDFAGASVSDKVSPEEVAALQERDGHTVLYVSTSSAWDALALPLRFAERLYGLAAAALALVAVVLLVRIRWRLALFPAGVLFLYAVTHTRLYTRWENLSAMIPAFLLAPAWGLSLVRNLPFAAARRAPWTAIFVTLAMLGGAWSAWSHADGAGITELTGWVTRRDSESTLAARMMEEEVRSLPVVLLAPSDRFPYLLCPDRSDVAGVRKCQHAAETFLTDGGFRIYTLGDRAVAASVYFWVYGHGDQGCPDFGRLLASPSFDGGFLAVYSEDYMDFQESRGPCDQRFNPENCDVLARTPRLYLVRCRDVEGAP